MRGCCCLCVCCSLSRSLSLLLLVRLLLLQQHVAQTKCTSVAHSPKNHNFHYNFAITCAVCVPCVCVCECVTIWIIKCTSLHFQQISFTLLHFKLTHSRGRRGVGWCDGVWSQDARVTYNLGWVKYKKKHTQRKNATKTANGARSKMHEYFST